MRSISLLISVFAIILIAFVTKNSAGDCNIYGLSLKIGERQSVPGKCSEIQCNGKGSTDYVITACPNAYSPPHCKFVPVDLSKAYPDCCPHWDC